MSHSEPKKKKVSTGLPPLRVGLLATEDQRKAAVHAYGEEQLRRMEALADSLGIPNDISRWYLVALHLARQHVPELRDAKPIGAPTKWGDYELGVLAVEIEREQQQQGGGTVERAAAALAERPPWREFLQEKGGTHFGPDRTAALMRMYSVARKHKFARVAREAFLYHQHPEVNTVHEWDAEVLAIKPPNKK